MAEKSIAASDGHVTHQPGVERRARVRFLQSQDVYCQPKPFSAAEGQPTGWLGKFQNISAGGLALLMNQRFEPGTLLVIELGVDRAVGSVAARVVHTTASTAGRWIIGCQFLHPLSEDDLQTLVAELPSQS
jgi:hypothetical protein